MDRALKPSLATYQFRLDKEIKYTPAVQAAQDDDESLLAMVEQQADVANGKLRMGEARQAVTVLRRAYQVADAHEHPGSPGYVPPVKRLALASIRLQLCAVLSKIDRHVQALAEARAAKLETDELWRSSFAGLVEAEAAGQAGDFSRPPAPLRKLLVNPPKWLPRVVEVSIQARQCIALEIEYCLPVGKTLETAGAPAVDESVPPEGLPRPPPTPAQEVEEMHQEAVMLAQQLLPDGHPVRSGAERACLQGKDRKTNPGGSPLSGAARRSLAASSSQSKQKLPDFVNNSLMDHSTTSTIFSALNGEMGFLRADQSPASQDKSWDSIHSPISPHQKLFASRGDVLTTSLPRSRSSPTPVKAARRASVSRGSVSNSSDPMNASLAKTDKSDKTADAFGDWKKSVSDVNKMSLSQIRMRDFDGIKHLHSDLKTTTAQFKQGWLKDLDDDVLYDYRTLYCEHGVQATKKAEKRMETFKKQTWQPSDAALQKDQDKKDIFSYYGVEPASGKKSKSKHIDAEFFCLADLFRGQIERSPEEQERRFKEQQAQNKAVAEEKAAEDAKRRQSMQASMGGLGFGSKPSVGDAMAAEG